MLQFIRRNHNSINSDKWKRSVSGNHWEVSVGYKEGQVEEDNKDTQRKI